MVRKEQQRKAAERRASRVREGELDAAQVHGDYEPPTRADCTQRHYYQHLDDDGRIRVDVRVWRHGGRVVDFHLIAEVMRLEGLEWTWVGVARVDICHGHAHVHPLVGERVGGEPYHVMRIETVEDVHEALRLSIVSVVETARTLPLDEGSADDG